MFGETILQSVADQNLVPGDKCCIVITDTSLAYPGPRIMFIAGDVLSLTGYELHELLGKSPRILQGPETDHREMCRLRETCGRGEYYTGTLVNYRKDGTPFYMGLSISPIKMNGEIKYYFAIQSDVTNKQQRAQICAVRESVNKMGCVLDTASNNIQDAVKRATKLLLTIAGT